MSGTRILVVCLVVAAAVGYFGMRSSSAKTGHDPAAEPPTEVAPASHTTTPVAPTHAPAEAGAGGSPSPSPSPTSAVLSLDEFRGAVGRVATATPRPYEPPAAVASQAPASPPTPPASPVVTPTPAPPVSTPTPGWTPVPPPTPPTPWATPPTPPPPYYPPPEGPGNTGGGSAPSEN